MYCTKCGAKNEDGARFCMQCGNRLTAAERGDEFAEEGIPPRPRERNNKRGVYAKPRHGKTPLVIALAVVVAVAAIMATMAAAKSDQLGTRNATAETTQESGTTAESEKNTVSETGETESAVAETVPTESVLNIETGEFEEVTFDASGVMQWDDFVAAYPDVVCILELSGEEFEEYTESMWICEFQLRDGDGNLLERAGAFNITGYGTDPVGWGETYGPITYQSSDGYDSDTFYIRYGDIIVVGPASVEINTYVTSTPDEGNALFNTIAGRTFVFTSGIGGWGTTMVINADGTFTGRYSDTDYDTSEDSGVVTIVYQCSFSGQFSMPEKVSDYEYVMYLESLETEQESGSEYSEYDSAGAKTTYINTDPYGLDSASEIRIYLPTAPTSELPEKFLGWASMLRTMDGTDTGTEELGCYGLYNVNGEEGFFAD